MGAKIEINLTNKWLYSLVSLVIFVALIAIVFAAYNYINTIPNPGHGADTVWVNTSEGEMTLQDAIDNGYIGGGGGGSAANYQYQEFYYSADSFSEDHLNTPLGHFDLCIYQGIITSDGSYGGASYESHTIQCRVYFNTTSSEWHMVVNGGRCWASCLNYTD